MSRPPPTEMEAAWWKLIGTLHERGYEIAKRHGLAGPYRLPAAEEIPNETDRASYVANMEAFLLARDTLRRFIGQGECCE